MGAVGIHLRRAGEYVRPAGRILLDDYGRTEGEYYAPGTYHHQDSLSRFRAGQKVEAELVPEPSNPWDARAVAYDVDGHRVAYLPTTAAKMWHDVVRGWNAAGFAVYVAAKVNSWEGDGEARFGLTVPKWGWQNLLAMAEAAGLRAASEAAVEGLPQEQRLRMREDGGYTPGEPSLRALRRKREQYPMFAWGGTRDGDLSERMPFWYGYFVREQMREEEELLRCARSVKSALTRGFRDEIGRRKEREREQERLRRRAQEEQALRLQGEGRRNREIAEELALTPKQVENLLRRARKAEGITLRHNEDLRAERHRAAADALRHRKSGMTRAQIAHAMGRSVDSVKDLLQDAVFYDAPEDHPERLALARHCTELRGAGLAKDEVLAKLGVTRAKGLRAFRDASFLGTDVREARDEAVLSGG
ncbi:hypothetical protein ACFWVP_27950 [Streptomyces sp. NPDC058637]|uniref:hypothetical protein n=1 Tax=Streptomyces sp. NPDC058637 TaxID=3346569 RepID=UPI003651D08D